jgi:endonuclease/exonuclease/phosphatase family metal-dependent hydrolase
LLNLISNIISKLGYILLLSLCLFQYSALSQASTIPITIITYNTSDNGNVWTATTPSRVVNMRSVINAIDPDIFVAIEINNSNTDSFLTNILNYSSNTYSKGTFIPNNDSISPNSNCLYYKTNKFKASSFDNTVIPSYLDLTQTTRGRDINKFTIMQNGGETIVIYAVHLKPDGSGGSATIRAAQIQYLLDYINNNSSTTLNENFIVLGDFNINKPDEGAYKNLFVSQGAYFYDPSNPSGTFGSTWDTSTFIPYLSFQSTNLTEKYDNILISGNVKNNTNGIQYHSGSFTVYGNPNSYGGSSTDPDASTASDHLPVYATFDFIDNLAPVELTSFIGNVKDGVVELNWSTATEVNNYGFEIQRSTDKVLWSKIGFVQGHGTSNAPKDYTFKDKLVQKGVSYYRLKQIDVDGKYEYSPVIVLNNKFPLGTNLSQNYPNPFNPVTIINYSLSTNGYVSLRVYDVLGREISTLVDENQNAGKHTVNFNGSGLASGIYVYILRTDNIVLYGKMDLLK